jgi:hypothetical protein
MRKPLHHHRCLRSTQDSARHPEDDTGRCVVQVVENPDDPSEAEDLGRLGQAHWFGPEGAWFVTVTGSTGIHPSENLDFAPTVTDEEVAAFQQPSHIT